MPRLTMEMYVGRMDQTWYTTNLTLDYDERDTDAQLEHQAVQRMTEQLQRSKTEAAFVGVYHYSRDEEIGDDELIDDMFDSLRAP